MHGSTRCLLGLATAAVLLVAGCGDDAEPAAAKDQQSAPTTKATTKATSDPTDDAKPTKAYTVEQLAAVLGCKPQFQGKAKDLRQASCDVAGDSFVLVQFAEESGQRDWLEYATSFGGVYLSGDRWVLSGKSKEYMESLQEKLGGRIEEEPS